MCPTFSGRQLTSFVAVMLLVGITAFLAAAADVRDRHEPGRHDLVVAQSGTVYTSAIYSRSGTLSPRDLTVIVVSGVALALLVIAWRRPPAADRGPALRSSSAPSRAVISLSCPRCARVVDLSRDRLPRRLFCPRCGGLMRGDA